jgi:hypothetical protein
MKPSIGVFLLAGATAFGLFPRVAAAECFSMYDTKNALVYQSQTSPIDLSRPISEEMARHYPSRALVISTSISCEDGRGGSGASRFIGAEESGDLYGSTTSAADRPATADRAAGAPRVVRRESRR